MQMERVIGLANIHAAQAQPTRRVCARMQVQSVTGVKTAELGAQSWRGQFDARRPHEENETEMRQHKFGLCFWFLAPQTTFGSASCSG